VNRTHDQAEQLRKQIEGQNKQEPDVLSLPPRSEVHKAKETKTKMKWKIKYPLIRLLALFFILLPFAILGIYYTNDKPAVVPVKQNGSYEPIDIENKPTPSSAPLRENASEPTSSSAPSRENISETTASPAQSSEMESELATASRAKTVDNQMSVSRSNAASSEQQVITHVVQENETLFSIAMHYYETKDGMDIIKKWNHLETAQLYKGQVLQIPLIDLTK